MANGWSPEGWARQSAAIRRWKPWERSTTPQTVKVKTSRPNVDKGGKRPVLRTELAYFRELMRELVVEQREGR